MPITRCVPPTRSGDQFITSTPARSPRPSRAHAHRVLTIAVLCTAWSCSRDPAPGPVATEPPSSAAALVPIDRDGSGSSPATYKGLPLELRDNGAPVVTPVDGIIGLVCVGMSNGFQECGDFVNRARTEYSAEINASVRIVNCAVGGHAIERWNDPAEDGDLWDRCVTQRLPAAGVRLDQVRVLWHKAANQFTTGTGGAALPTYPSAGSDYEAFIKNLDVFAGRVRSKFPAVQAVYTSSRSYGGYAGSAARGEPLSYEEGHALNQWLARNPVVAGVWYGWGPYLWAPACSGGTTNGSGVCYDRADYVADGVHPSASGQAKVSRMLHERFRREGWYR